MKHSLKKTLLIATLALNASAAFAAVGADKGGNGGGAQYCPNPTGTQLKFEAYDLWYGKIPLDPTQALTIPSWDGKSSKEDYLAHALTKVRSKNEPLASALQRALTQLNSKVIDSGNRELTVVNDAQALMHDRGCQYYQLVNWIDSEEDLKRFGLKAEVILRDQNAYGQMDPLNQAANDLHEAAYKVARVFNLIGDSGSIPVQRFTAEAFSTQEISDETLSRINHFGKLLFKKEANRYPQAYFYLSNECSLGELKRGNLKITNASKGQNIRAFSHNVKGRNKLRPGESLSTPLFSNWSQSFVKSTELSKSLNYVAVDFINRSIATYSIQMSINVCEENYSSILTDSTGGYWAIQALPNPI